MKKNYGFSMSATIAGRKRRAAELAAAEKSTDEVLQQVRTKGFAKLPDNYEFISLLIRKGKGDKIRVQDVRDGWLVCAERRG